MMISVISLMPARPVLIMVMVLVVLAAAAVTDDVWESLSADETRAKIPLGIEVNQESQRQCFRIQNDFRSRTRRPIRVSQRGKNVFES